MARKVKPKVRDLTKKRKSQFKPEDDDWNFNLESDDDFDLDYDPDFSEEGPARPQFSLKRVLTGIDLTKTDKHGKKVLDINILAQQKQVEFSEYLMEIVTARQMIPAHWDLDHWAKYLHEVGHAPFYILQGDVDRYMLCIYAAEILRLAGTEGKAARDRAIKYLPKHPAVHRDINEAQPALDGTQWGGVFAEDYPEGSPIREQIEKAQKRELEQNKAQSGPAPVQTKDPYLERWRVAERIAREVPRYDKDNPAHGWEGNLDYGFERMVKYCYDWIRDIGSVPEIPSDMQDLFWPKKFIGLCLKEKSIERRESIVGKTMRYIWKLARKHEGEIDFTYRSYRRILAAKNLARAIEKYATNWKHYEVKGTGPDDITTMVLNTPDDECIEHVKVCVRAYVDAHRPLEKLDHPPGPLDTLDPSYVQYLEIIRKYNIKEGTLLHEAEL